MNTSASSAGPAVVGVGMDLADVARVQAALDRRAGLVDRLFTGAELAFVERSAAVSVAQRFAAKEAVMKALGVGIDTVAFTEIELDERLVTVVLSGRARRRASEIGAHSFAIDVGVVEGPEGDVATAEVVASSTVS